MQEENITYNDGKNFVGGESELRALVTELDNNRMTQLLNSKSITWKPNPPLT